MQQKQLGRPLQHSRSIVSLCLPSQYGLKIPKWEEEGNAIRQGTEFYAVGEVSATPAFYTHRWSRDRYPPLQYSSCKLMVLDIIFGNFQTIVGYDTPTSVYGDNSVIVDYVDSETANGVVRQTSGMGWSAGAKMTLQAGAATSSFSIRSTRDSTQLSNRKMSWVQQHLRENVK